MTASRVDLSSLINQLLQGTYQETDVSAGRKAPSICEVILCVGENLTVRCHSSKLHDISSQVSEVDPVLLDPEDKHKTGGREFDFFIDGILISGSLKSHIDDRGIPIENVIQIEFVERSPPPVLSDVFDHSDWVSCIHCNRRL